MNTEVKISIIMPVYKVEQYVGKAIESIQAQTLKEFEFLIVDDGSPDNSGKICDEYAERDSRIHVIHKENGGAPSARNTAIDIAKGKYMYFMDSDDWAEPTMLEDMYNLAEQNKSQLVIAGFYIDTYYSKSEYITNDFVTEEDMVFNEAADFRKNAYKIFDKNLLYSPWNKLFLTSYLLDNNLRFPETFWDDFPFVLSVIRDIERVTVTTKQYYHFIRARAESETAAYRPNMYEKREEEHEWMLDIYRHWKVKDKDSKEMVARRYIERFIGCIENVTNSNCTLKFSEKYHQVKEMLSTHNVRWSLKFAQPRSRLMKIMLIPIKMNSAFLTLVECKVISIVKAKNVKMFATLKARR